MAKKIKTIVIDPNEKPEIIERVEKGLTETQNSVKVDLNKTLLEALANYEIQTNENVHQRRSLTFDPKKVSTYRGLFIPRDNMLPYFMLKELFHSDDLLATILNQKSAQISPFGQPQTNRHELGFRVVYREPDIDSRLPPNELKILKERMIHCKNLLYRCGYEDGLSQSQKTNLPQFLKEIVKQALVFGWIAVERVPKRNGETAYFRAVDAGSIYRAKRHASEADRQKAQQDLISLQNTVDLSEIKNLQSLQALANGDPRYKWVQVIDDIPRAAFTDEELLVYPVVPATDIENDSYPRPIVDSIVKAVSTHINITTQNHLFFANGRAAKGMLIIQSATLTETVMQRLRQQFYASINSAANSHRMPLFNIGQDDKINWVPIESARDGEFQYLDEKTTRVILAAFSMSPDEIPALNNITRPIPTQALADSNNEYKIMASRQVGLYALLQTLQTVMNELLKHIDPMVSEHCIFKFVGLASDDAQRELAQSQQAANLWMSPNELRRVFEAEPYPGAIGKMPMNPQLLNMIANNEFMNKYLYLFGGDRAVLTDPTLQFIQNGNWFNFISGPGKDLLKSKGRIAKALNEALEELRQIVLKKKQ